MKTYRFIIAIVVAVFFSSCSTIRFGRSTTVTIETEHPGDVVDILAIGPKKTVDIQQVTLPYKYKAKHNNLPLRVDIISKDNIYDPFTIGAEHKGEFIGLLSKWWGYLSSTVSVGVSTSLALTSETTLAELALGCGPTLGLGAALLAIGYTAETDIPDSKYYLTSSVPVDSLNMYQLEGWWIRQKALEDVYTLLSQEEYKLSKAKATFLLKYEPTAELYYLRGISSYYLGKHKEALIDLNEALSRLNVEINPGLRDEVAECISAVEQSIAIKKEQRAQMWSQIAGTVLQAGVEAYSMYQQAKLADYRNSHGMTSSGVVIDPSKLSQGDLNQLINPQFALQQVLSQEMQEYQQFCRYNKKADGSNYTLDEFRAFQGEAIQLAKENGYDILAEQRRQADEDRKWSQEQRQKDKESWFARYGYDITKSSKTDSHISSTNSSNVVSANETQAQMTYNSSTTNKSEFDSKQQYKSEPVSSESYQRIKSIELYDRNGDKATKMNISADLYKKGAFMYVKIGNKYYPRTAPNWQRFRNAILYGTRQLYYND